MVESLECGTRLAGERCGEEINTALHNYINSLKSEYGCHDGLFWLCRFLGPS